MYLHYAGPEFHMLGIIQRGAGVFDASGSVLSANLYDQLGTTLIGILPVTWVDPPTGLFQILEPDTSTWPTGKARIQAALKTASGVTFYSRPTYIRVMKPLS